MVILIDADPGHSATDSLGLEIEGEPLCDLLDGKLSLGQALVEPPGEAFRLVPGSERLSDPALGTVEHLAARLRAGIGDRIVITIASGKGGSGKTTTALALGSLLQKEGLQAVVIDTAQGTTLPITRAALKVADIVVIPVQPEPKVVERSYHGVVAMLDLYDNSNAELLFVATMVQKNLSLTQLQLTLLSKKGVDVAAHVPRGVACSEADLYNKSVISYKPKSPPAQAYLDLGRAVIARMNKNAFRKGA
jgi:cellulose biosynthesis protein BcsQ